jgi:hypothetical protein
MNERMRALASQAYRQAIEASKIEPTKCDVGSFYFDALKMEKFAELLIKDCLVVHNCIDTDNWTSSGALEEAERLIKDRFDIKD